MYKLLAIGQRYSHICNYFTLRNLQGKLFDLNDFSRFGAAARTAILGGNTPK